MQAHGTTVRAELVAGLTTFLTLSCILFVRPAARSVSWLIAALLLGNFVLVRSRI